MIVELNGRRIHSEADFHAELAQALDLGPYYGRNLDALWDRLSFDVKRPIDLRWIHASGSRRLMGKKDFDGIKRILERVERHDLQRGWPERFQVSFTD